MSRVLTGVFIENPGADGSRTRGRDHELTILDALDVLTPDQRATMLGLFLEFAGTVRKPKKGANHRTRDLLAFLASPQVLDWFSGAQLHRLAGDIAIAAYVRAHEDESSGGPTKDDTDHKVGGA